MLQQTDPMKLNRQQIPPDSVPLSTEVPSQGEAPTKASNEAPTQSKGETQTTTVSEETTKTTILSKGKTKTPSNGQLGSTTTMKDKKRKKPTPPVPGKPSPHPNGKLTAPKLEEPKHPPGHREATTSIHGGPGGGPFGETSGPTGGSFITTIS